MRLNGKAAIVRYLGMSDHWRNWVSVRLRYGRVIWVKKGIGGRKPRYWTHTEWLDAVDREHGETVYDAEYAKLVALHTAHEGRIPKARELVLA